LSGKKSTLPNCWQVSASRSSTRGALESQRRSGYHGRAAASRELVDNSIEAGADRVHVVFDAGRNDNGRRSIDATAFIDNGSGMVPNMARYALGWGGTHFDEPDVARLLVHPQVTANPLVQGALRILYEDGVSIGQAAAAVNLSRFTLRRALSDVALF